MKSIDKLKRLTGEDGRAGGDSPFQASSPPSSARQAELADLRRRIEALANRAKGPDRTSPSAAQLRGREALAEILSGEERENEYGRFFLVSEAIRTGSAHGRRIIHDALQLDMTAAARLANNPGLCAYHPSEALFLDTETTGLAGGTGTVAFLIGLGWFAEGRFHLRQILARDFSEEAAQLAHLNELLREKRFLVTFNGKAFDVNLLATRFILNRLPDELSALPHLDLLHPARRLVGHRLVNSRLTTLEEEVLGVRREGDIEGWEIPQRYFDWLRRHDPRLLLDVFRHNRLDIISLATLTAHLTGIVTAEVGLPAVHAEDYLAAADLLIKRNDLQGADKILGLFQEERCRDLAPLAKRKLARLCKQTGKKDEAARFWQELIEEEDADHYITTELAKWLEHGLRDYAGAKAVVEKALRCGNDFSGKERASLEHRRERLKRKLKAVSPDNNG